MGQRYPRAEWMRREYWKAKGVDPDSEEAQAPPPPHAPGFNPPDDDLRGHLGMIRRRVVDSTELSDLERVQWLGALRMAESGKPTTMAVGLKRLAELQRTAPASVSGADTVRPGAGLDKTPQQRASELMKERLDRFKAQNPPRLVVGEGG